MNPHLFFNIFTPVIIFNVAFDMDIYMFHKLFWQILLITIPGFLMNYILVLWYLTSVNKLLLKTIPWLLFSSILVSSDPTLTAVAVRDLAQAFLSEIWSYFIASFLFGILSSKLIQLWLSTVFDDDVNYISLSFSVVYLIYFICELVGMSGIFTLAIIGLFLNSTNFKPGVEALLLKFWNCLSFVALLMVFTFIGLLIPAHTYLSVSLSDVYYLLNTYFTLIVLRLLVFLAMSPLLSRIGHGFNWRWAFIIVWSEMKGTPNITMALLLAYSDLPLGSEREKSQLLFHGVSVCLVSLIVNRLILPTAVSKLGLLDVTSTKNKSLYYTFQHFQELTKSTVSTLKFDKDLANADWHMVEEALILQNPYALNQGEATGHQKMRCPDCNKEIDETLNIETMELAKRRLLSAQIASYQRQYKNEILSKKAVQLLEGAAGSFGDKKGEYMSLEAIKKYYESIKFLGFIRKLLLKCVYNTKKGKGTPSRYCFLHVCHKIVFTDEFEYVGYLVILMNMFPIIISWISVLGDIYKHELKYSNYLFLAFYILEALLKIAAMRKEYFLHIWNKFELAIIILGIIDVILTETNSIDFTFDVTQMVVFMKLLQLVRVLRILKLVTPKLLQITDKRISHQLSFKYAILKGYVQGEVDTMTIIDEIASSEEVKQMLLRRVTKNTGHAMEELGYFEYDHPEITITMKTKEEINVMLNLATEIVNVFRLKGIIHEVESSEIDKLIMAKKKEILDFQPIIKPLTVEEALSHIPWLDKNENHIRFIQERARILTFDCENDVFEEGDEPKGIYIILSGMIKLQRSKPDLRIDEILWESEEKDYEITYTDYLISGEIIGEINCLTNTPMKYSATCKTVVETCFISKNHLYEAFQHYCPHIEYKMWLKLGLSITARKIREHLSYEDWNYKMQLKLCNIYVKDIPRNTKTSIYNKTVIYIILIHGAIEDCYLRKAYKAPFLIPIPCYQVQGTEDFTKVMIVQTSTDVKKLRRSTRKYVCSHKPSLPSTSVSAKKMYEDDQDETTIEIQQPTQLLHNVREKMEIYGNT
ncbi:solute carrier family 9 member C1 isoform X1 [Manis javanica]|uniref:solute carrier family 9 member C1 isoform X1 n=1 Tax=Manis javanica TaxID=9974 RepID=UPI003C6DA133